MVDPNIFEGFSAALDALPEHLKEATSELIWSHRDGVLSVCWVTYDLDAYIEVLGGTVPMVITNAYSSRYFVDLESLTTDKKRLYIDSPNEGEVLIGYYFSSLDPDAWPDEYKVYRRDGRDAVLIDRYSGDGSEISLSEGEVVSKSDTDWTGPPEILAITKNLTAHPIILKKTSKPQSYVRVTL